MCHDLNSAEIVENRRGRERAAMAMEPFVPFLEEYNIHGGGGDLFWALSPELHFDCAGAFPDVPPEFDPPVDLLPPSPPAAAAMVHRSAFRRYAGLDGARMMECSCSGTGGGRNIHWRVIEMLRRIPKAEEPSAVEMSRGFRHMMRERQRREKLSQSYADLYSILAARSKSDKNSIVQSAAQYVRELKGVKEALQQRNEVLKAKILGGDLNEGAKIKIKVANPSSPIDSMIGALQCLKSMDVKAKAIRSDLSSAEFSGVLSIETKMATADVERAVEGTLMEVEKKLRCELPGISTGPQ